MTLVVGVDPGLSGAFAMLDAESGDVLEAIDMPTFNMAVGSKKRKRLDAVEIAEILATYKMVGVELVVIEAVGGRPKQSASAGFVFGYSVGLIYMGCIMARLPIETIPPQTWKKMMRIPGKAGQQKKDADDAIMARAAELFPDHMHMFKGERGGKRVDRAEAAMLALFGQRNVLNDVAQRRKHKRDTEWKNVYRRANTGT